MFFGVIGFINTLDRHFSNRKKVYVVLANVKKVHHDALVVLLSMLVKFKVNNIAFNGDFPEDPHSRRVIVKSGFFDYILKPISRDSVYSLSGQKSFYTHANLNVNSDLTAELLHEYSKKIWGMPKRYTGAQRTFIELMQNTNNHASSEREGDKHWWLSVNYDSATNQVCFAFVDYGIGIFNSLDNKKIGDKFHDWKTIFKRTFGILDNPAILKNILIGKLHQTVTGFSYRGRGLPGIFTVLERSQISNLHIITNDVYASVSKDSYSLLPISFSGTFVYFEINKNNVCLNDED